MNRVIGSAPARPDIPIYNKGTRATFVLGGVFVLGKSKVFHTSNELEGVNYLSQQ